MDWEEYRQQLLAEQAELRKERLKMVSAIRAFNRVKEKLPADERIEREADLDHRLTQIDYRIEDITLELL